MADEAERPDPLPAVPAAAGKRYGALLRYELLRLFLTYLVPLLLISLFFLYQYHSMINESRRVHLTAVAENRASTLDLFLRERWVNLFNVIDNPAFVTDPTPDRVRAALALLRKTSTTFVDLGLLDGRGELLAYDGPYTFLESQNYGDEPWFRHLRSHEAPYIVTDIYLGFRDELHFTIAVRREIDGRPFIVRAALSPEGLYQEIASSAEPEDVYTCVVNADGRYQLVSPGQGEPLGVSPFEPPRRPSVGVTRSGEQRARSVYAYAWLKTAPWVLVTRTVLHEPVFLEPVYVTVIGFTTAVLLAGAVVLWIRARVLVRTRLQAQETEASLSGQLVQAAKLASVGELAAGIAHEINNPLAIIAEEVGLMKDLTDPQFEGSLTPDEMNERLDTIHNAVFRCRDITRKLLSFVRQTEVRLAPLDINELLDEVVDGLLGHELSLSSIEVVKQYLPEPPAVVVDRNQLAQVFVNLVRNAMDAMEGEGRLTVSTELGNGTISVSVADTGCGMTAVQVEKIFMPFYTTKEPGKGTGLGLSVSYNIINGLGGEIYVESKPGKGSCFRVALPCSLDSDPRGSPDEFPRMGRGES